MEKGAYCGCKSLKNSLTILKSRTKSSYCFSNRAPRSENKSSKKKTYYNLKNNSIFIIILPLLIIIIICQSK
jgi:hypothetical protein